MLELNNKGRKGAGYFYILLMFITVIIVIFVFNMVLMQWGATSLTKFLESVNGAKTAVIQACDASLQRSELQFRVTLPTHRMLIMHQCSDILERDQLVSPDQEITIKDERFTNMNDLCNQGDNDLEEKSLLFAWGETKVARSGFWNTLGWVVRGLGATLMPFSGGTSGLLGWWAGGRISKVGMHTAVKDLRMEVLPCDHSIPIKAFWRPSSGQAMTDYLERIRVVPLLDENDEYEVRLEHVIE